MSEPLANPTLVLGLGRFGGQVCALLSRQAEGEERPPNLVVLRARVGPAGPGSGAEEADDPSGPAGPCIPSVGDEQAVSALLGTLREAARGLLDLRQRVATTRAGDARPPRLDVFLLADLQEPEVPPLVPVLVERIGAGLRDAFRPIFVGTGGRLTVCPVLAMPRCVQGRLEVSEAVDALDVLSDEKDERKRPLAPIYLVEDQCARYVLSPDEVVRSVAAWLHLVLYSGLRHHEDALKSLVEHEGDSPAPFATFACATLELDTRPLERYCRARIAKEIAEAMLEEQDAIADAEGAAKRLSPEAVLAAALARGPNDRPIAEELKLKLDRAALALDDPHWRQSPEEIAAVLDAWMPRVLDSAEKQRADIEGFRMESAARRVDEGGLDVLAGAEKAVAAEVERCLAESPAGAERARLRLQALESRLKRLDESAQRAIDRPDLPPLPEPKRLKEVDRAAREALARRGRLGRMVTWGAAAALLLAGLLAGVARTTWRLAAAADQVPFFASDVKPEGWATWLAGWPLVAVWTLLIAAGWVAYSLWAHYRDEHRVLCLRFEDLRRAAREHYSELERYFARRLAYSQDLWAARVARHLLARVQGERALLEAARASLQKGRDRLDEEIRAEAGATSPQVDGVLFRGLLSGEDMAAIYEAKARPQNPSALAQRFLAESAGGQLWRSGAFAEQRTLLRFAERICPDLTRLRPFADTAPSSGPGGGGGWAQSVRERAAQFLRQLSCKLTVPLELDVDAEGRTTSFVAYVPRESRAEVEAVLKGEDLSRRWAVREADDERRLHLLIATRDIERRSLKLLRPDPEGA